MAILKRTRRRMDRRRRERLALLRSFWSDVRWWIITLGPNDPQRKQSEYLVPWEELADRGDVREYDREFVLPMILATLGYRIVRVSSRPRAV